MSNRGLSYRRCKAEKAKRRANFLWCKVRRSSRFSYKWNVEHNSHVFNEPSNRWLGIMASTHCKPCSCYHCGNPRRHGRLKDRLSRQEREQLFDDEGE